MHSVCHGETKETEGPCKEPLVEVQSIGTEYGITLLNGLCKKTQGDSQCLTYRVITCRIVRIAWLVLIVSITAPTTTTMKETMMLSNLYRRLTIWWGDILAWNWKRKRRKRKQWKFEGHDD